MRIFRLATPQDWPEIWSILEPVFRAGETYAIGRDISEADSRTYWLERPAACYVALQDGVIVGTYYIHPNHNGGGAHVCNCGYVVAQAAQGQGIARMMCEASQTQAHALGFRAMQFNLVLQSNTAAVGLWQNLGFKTIGTIPSAFDHPQMGYVDAYVMHKALTPLKTPA